MTTPLLLVVAIMGGAVVWLFRQTINVKPWAPAEVDDPVHGGASFPAPASAVGLGVFLAVATSLFALSVCAYFMRMMQADWTGMVFPGVLWANTIVLVLSDLTMRGARNAARRADPVGIRRNLAVSGICGFVFLAGQVWAWQELNSSGYFSAKGAAEAISASPANSFFYLFTALHGAHLLGGLLVWGRTTARAWRGEDARRIRVSVELCTTYWHYLLLVWLILLALLVPAVSELCRGRLFN
jgi:cytochrome c oxidase subunit III